MGDFQNPGSYGNKKVPPEIQTSKQNVVFCEKGTWYHQGKKVTLPTLSLIISWCRNTMCFQRWGAKCGWQAGGEGCGGAKPGAAAGPLGQPGDRACTQPSLGRAAGTEGSRHCLCLPLSCQDEPCRAQLLFALKKAFLAPSVQYVAVALVTTP